MSLAEQAFWWLLIPTAFVLFLVVCGFVIECVMWSRSWIRRLRKLEAGREAQRSEHAK